MSTLHIIAKRGTILCCAFFILMIAAADEAISQNKQEYGSKMHALKTEDQQHPANLDAFSDGEELTYEVSYMGVGLGTVTARITGVKIIGSNKFMKAECLIKTYKGVPFVSLNTLFQSTMDPYCSSISFSSRDAYKDTVRKYVQYRYKPKRDSLYIFERLGKKLLDDKFAVLSLDGLRWQDGLSLFYYARAHAHQKFSDKVPVLMYKDKASANINFGVLRETIEIDAVDYDIKTVKLDGKSNFTGIYGLTGGFEGWFSDDKAGVPIYAKMHVFLGSVRVELIKWKKKGWKPPRASG